MLRVLKVSWLKVLYLTSGRHDVSFHMLMSSYLTSNPRIHMDLRWMPVLFLLTFDFVAFLTSSKIYRLADHVI